MDSHVGKHLFEKVIGPKGILKDKVCAELERLDRRRMQIQSNGFDSAPSPTQTRILVTHGVSFLPYVDEIVVLVDGVVSEVGSYKSLRASKGAFSEFLDTYAQEQRNRALSESGKHILSIVYSTARARRSLALIEKSECNGRD